MREALVRKITRYRLKKFLEKHKTEKKVLDIGACSASFKEWFPNNTTLDIDENMNPDVVGDAHKLPFEDDEFDVLLCTEVLEHLHSPHLAANEMRRVLKSGGKLVLSTRFIYPIHDSPHDYFRYTKYGLSHLFRDWKVEELSSETNTMETFAVLFQTIAWKCSLRGGKLMELLFLFTAFLLRKSSWVLREERSSGKRGPKVIEEDIMSSGYHLVCINTK